MDENNSRIPRLRKHGRYNHNVKQRKNYGRASWKYIQTHRGAFTTGTLVLLAVVLLFGLFSQFSPPVTNTVPNGETSIGYSTFITQVKSGNVAAVVIQGNTIDGLLTNSLSQGQSAQTTTSSVSTAQYTAWLRYTTAYGTSWNNMAPPVDSTRSIYTQMPATGDTQLSSLLLNQHVKVTTIPVQQSSGFFSLLLRYGPFVLLFIILITAFSSLNNSRGSKSVDERITQIGKSRARRFIRAKETTPDTAVLPEQKTSKQNSVKRHPGLKTPSASNFTATSTTATKQGTATAIAPIRTAPPVTFADVAGIDEVRTELEEIVQFLQSPDKFNRLGARIPRGALLVGPPGTGKTLLAKAVAGEANVPFFSMSASEFVEMFVGVGASRVRDLFNRARQVSPCVIFIDEIDAVGRKRSMRIGGNDERDQTLNQLLVELDGFDARQAVVVLAATNRADILDSALLRPGRFDRRITVSMPTRAGREAILKVHSRNTPLHEDVLLDRLARLTTGMSGADLANLVNEAALCAARQNLDKVTHECFEDALARVQLGALRPIVMSERERRIIAYHEGGHALVAHHLPEADTVNRVTILPRGQSLGVTHFTAEEDRYNYSRHTLMSRIAVGLGGRVAEEITFGADHITTGAENDLQVVTDIARRMVTRWGMSKEVGVVFADYRPEDNYALNMRRLNPDDLPSGQHSRSLIADEHGRLYLNGSDERRCEQAFAMAMAQPGSQSSNGVAMNALIDAEVQAILKEGHTMAHNILMEHRDQLILLADTLMEREQIDRAQFEALFTM